jgi:hypothetical protein
MSEEAAARRLAVVRRALHGPAVSDPGARRAAFDGTGDARVRALVEKVARNAWKVTDPDVAAVKAAGVSEDEIFELSVCAALGQATRQLEAALAVVDAATGERGGGRTGRAGEVR